MVKWIGLKHNKERLNCLGLSSIGRRRLRDGTDFCKAVKKIDQMQSIIHQTLY